MEVLARVLHRQPVVWLRALPGSGLGGKQMTFPGCGGPHQALWRSEKKTGIPKREREFCLQVPHRIPTSVSRLSGCQSAQVSARKQADGCRGPA